jgi:hypothetical protein
MAQRLVGAELVLVEVQEALMFAGTERAQHATNDGWEIKMNNSLDGTAMSVCYNTPCNIAASDCFRPLEHSRSWLIPSTGTSPCCQPSHHGTAPSLHPCPYSPVLLGVSLLSSIWITLDQLRSLILGHLGTPPLSLIGLSPLSLAHSPRTTPGHLSSLIPDFLHSLIMTSLDPLDIIHWYCHHHRHLCVIVCLVSFELYLLVASPECFRL